MAGMRSYGTATSPSLAMICSFVVRRSFSRPSCQKPRRMQPSETATAIAQKNNVVLLTFIELPHELQAAALHSAVLLLLATCWG